MTSDADLKRLIRERMATTGENYTTARSALLAAPAPRPTGRPAPDARPRLPQGDAAYEKTLRAFTDGARVTTIPARRRPRAAILLHLLTRFEGGREYAESEVNDILGAAHDDYAWLRREMINYRYLTREGGRYRVAEQAPERDAGERQEVPSHEADVIAALHDRG